MNVHVICCNDDAKFAIIDDAYKAIDKLNELRENYYEQNKAIFKDRDEYNNRVHWHIQTVNGE